MKMRDKVLLVVPAIKDNKKKRYTKELLPQIKESVGLFVPKKTQKILDYEDHIIIKSSSYVEIAEIVSRFPGIEYVAIAEEKELGFTKIVNAIVEVGKKEIYQNERFAVNIDSLDPVENKHKDLEAAATSGLLVELGKIKARPNQESPNKIVKAFITKKRAYVFAHKYLGPGGIPIGESIDACFQVEPSIRSIISSWLAQRAGITPHYFIALPNCKNETIFMMRSIESVLRLRRTIPKKNINLSFANFSHPIKQHFQNEMISDNVWLEILLKCGSKIAKEKGLRGILPSVNLTSNFLRKMSTIKEATNKESVLPILTGSFLNHDELIKFDQFLGSAYGRLPIDLDQLNDETGKDPRKFSKKEIDMLIDSVMINVKTISLGDIKEAHTLVDELMQ